jgi:hypothetical protein
MIEAMHAHVLVLTFFVDCNYKCRSHDIVCRLLYCTFICRLLYIICRLLYIICRLLYIICRLVDILVVYCSTFLSFTRQLVL